MKKEYKIDYTGFDPEKEYKIKNDKAKRSMRRMYWEDHGSPRHDSDFQRNLFDRWAAENPEAAKEAWSRGGKNGGAIGGNIAYANLLEFAGSVEAAAKIIADRFYNSWDEDTKKQFHSKGGSACQEKYGAGYQFKEYAKKDPDQIKRAQASSLKNRADKMQIVRDRLWNYLPNGWFTIESLNPNDLPEGVPVIYKISRWLHEEERYEVCNLYTPLRYRKNEGVKTYDQTLKRNTPEWNAARKMELYRVAPNSFTQYELCNLSRELGLGNLAPMQIIKDAELVSVHRPKVVNGKKGNSKILAKVYTKLKQS